MTLVQRVRLHAERLPDEPAIVFLADGDNREQRITFGELDRAAETAAAGLRAQGFAGRCVMLSFPSGLEFVTALLGCLYCGAIAVPTSPARSSDTSAEARQAMVAKDCGAAAALTTTTSIEARRARADTQSGDTRWASLDEINLYGGRAYHHTPSADDVAFLQYTSGSTSIPKGVVVRHANLAANFAAISHATQLNAETVFMSWLPLYHDMGLIGCLLHALYRGQKLVLMSPLHFMQRPLRWPRAISQHRATLSGGPNFAYDLCVRRSTPDQRAELDLSSWDIAFNGAEPVRASTAAAFCDAFSKQGFKPRSLFPCYGMAETTLYATGRRYDRDTGQVRVDRERLSAGFAQLSVDPESSDQLVSCGPPPPAHEVVIVDPESRAVRPEGEIGEIWLRGPSVSGGYWGGRDAGAFGNVTATGVEGFLRTGDLGVLLGGELFITGRIKDLIIVRGRNVYPHDVEWIAERSSPDAELGSAVAVVERHGDEERLVVVQEVRRARGVPPKSIRRQVVAAVTAAVEVSPAQVVLVRSGSIPKTSSGKVQRYLVRQALKEGSLQTLEENELKPSPVEVS